MPSNPLKPSKAKVKRRAWHRQRSGSHSGRFSGIKSARSPEDTCATSYEFNSDCNLSNSNSKSYDANGRRTAIGGSYAQSDLPAAISTTTYNAANQLTKWGSATLSYDANGNLLSDGSLTHGWNARNQLASLSGGAVASFQYDALGRRIGKTVAGSATGFLHDGINPVQELTGSTPKANLLTGLGVDEIFSRTDASGARHLLTDALGSTLALTDGAGAVQTSYSYEPYGKTTVSGTASSNSFEYTGRENDSTGLYFYRARYYNPGLQRFVSEDPIGLAGGPNVYGYVGGNPLSRVDPMGLDWIYSQSTGGLSRIDGGVSNPVATGYAGNGSNLNNPAGQSQPNSGPVPQGDYSIGPQRNSPNTGRGIMDLIPYPTNNMFGRSAFQIHGDNSRGDQSASNGCMILPRNIRDLIGGSGDNRLTVVP